MKKGDAQADLSLRWAHTHFVGFVMSRLILWFCSVLIVEDVGELQQGVYQGINENQRDTRNGTKTTIMAGEIY